METNPVKKRKLNSGKASIDLSSLGFGNLAAGLTKSAKSTKSEKTTTEHATETFEFKRNIDRVNKPQRLAAFRDQIRAKSVLGAAYYVPVGLIESLGCSDVFCDVLTAKPKSKQFRGKVTNPPWPLYDTMEIGGTMFYRVPRAAGLLLFGRPDVVRVRPGHPVDYTIHLDLYDGTKDYTINQQRAVQITIDHLRTKAEKFGSAGAGFILPTGNGKTACAAHMFARLGGKGLFVMPSMDQVTQTSLDFRKFLGDHIRIGTFNTSEARTWDIVDKDIMLTNWASISGIDYPDELMDQFRTVIVDEAHGVVSEKRSRMFLKFRGPYTIYLTATPEKTNECGTYLQWLVGPVTSYHEMDLTRTRWGRVDVEVHALSFVSEPLHEHYVKRTGDLDLEKTMQLLLHHRGRHAHLINRIQLELQNGRRCLVLGKRVAYMQDMHRDLTRRGIAAGLCVGKTADGRKLTLEEKDEAKRQPVLICTQSIGYQALNIVELDTLVLLDPPDVNDTFWRQVTGRIVRNDPNKQDPKIIVIRDQMGSGYYYSQLVDAAIRTMHRYSDDGYQIKEIEFDV